jgi:biotin carboxylase
VGAITQEVVVAIGFAEALSAPEVAWSLVDAGFDVIAFSRRGRRAALHHSHHVAIFEITAPEQDCAAALSELAAALESRRREHHVRAVLLPLDDASVWLCSRVQLASGWILAGASGDCAELALDKQKQVEAAAAAGFSVPATSAVATVEELAECVREYPTILRPACAVTVSEGRLRKGRNWICSNKEELNRARSAWNGSDLLLVQPFLEGTGEGVFGLATDHGVMAWSAHRRVRMMNPHGSGSSACISQAVPDGLKAPVAAFLESYGWRGMFMVELLRTRDERRWFVEFNGRAWGSMALSRRQGLEYPAWTVELALESQSAPANEIDGTEGVLCRNVGRELMHVLFVLRGSQSRAIRNWPSFWGTLIELLRTQENSSFYNWRREDWRVFVSDCWYTIRDQVFKSH